MNKNLRIAIKLIGRQFPDKEITNIYKVDYMHLIAYEFSLSEKDGEFYNVGRVFTLSKIITMR